MNRANELTKDEWPEWNINQSTAPIITLEGHHIQTVFSMIHTQLETLRKISTDSYRSMNEITKKDDKANERNMKIILKLQEKVEKLEEELSKGSTGQLIQKLNNAEERIQDLEDQLSLKSSSVMNETIHENKSLLKENQSQLQVLQNLMESVNLNDLTEKLKRYESQVKLLEIEKYETHARIVRLEDQACWYRNQAEKMNEEYVKLYENNELTAREIREFRDILLNYEKSHEGGGGGGGGAGSGGAAGGGGHSGGDHSTGGGPLTPFQENIIQSELNKLSNLIGNLDHKYHTLSSQYHDLSETYQNKLDKKIDWIKQWILKHLHDYFATQQQNHHDDDQDQTDIGKVRCLVCNHVTKKIDSDTPYNKPDFRNTLGYLHDGHGGGGGGTGGGGGAMSGGGGDDGIVYRSGFKIPLKEYQESYKLKAMISPQIQSNTPLPPQANRLIGSKFARIRAVPTGGGGGGGDYLFIDDDARIDLTQDTMMHHQGGGGGGPPPSGGENYRPKTTEGKQDKGISPNFYKEMER
jgi:hypothetical protein